MTDQSFVTQDHSVQERGHSSGSFLLPEMMTIETAETLASQLAALSLIEKNGLTLDASLVENITTPGIQIIASLQKTMSMQGGTLHINRMRPPFIQAFADTGLENLLR